MNELNYLILHCALVISQAIFLLWYVITRMDRNLSVKFQRISDSAYSYDQNMQVAIFDLKNGFKNLATGNETAILYNFLMKKDSNTHVGIMAKNMLVTIELKGFFMEHAWVGYTIDLNTRKSTSGKRFNSLSEALNWLDTERLDIISNQDNLSLCPE